MLNFERISKSFGSTRALEQVSLRLEPGTVVGMVGHNGAGKSTLMRMAVGLSRPDNGQVSICGAPVQDLGNLSGLVGASFDASTLPAAWSALTAVQIAGVLANAPADRVPTVLEMVGLTDAIKRRVGTYSMGMRQRLAIALALLADPRVLILDEPTNALDPVACNDLRNWIRAHAERGNTVLVSSHNLPEIERFADRIVVMQKGRIVRDAPTAELLAADAVLVRTAYPELLSAKLHQNGGTAEPLEDGALRVLGTTATDIGLLAAANGIALSELTPERRHLSDVYQLVTAEGARA
jgi:ABC-2 type transport system ATP-binding protein